MQAGVGTAMSSRTVIALNSVGLIIPNSGLTAVAETLEISGRSLSAHTPERVPRFLVQRRHEGRA
jgi:hypothetical protein